MDHVYGVHQTGGSYWVAFHVDFLKENIDCYDPITGHVTLESEQKMLDAFRPFTQMILAIMNDLVHAHVQKPSYKLFAFQRRKGKYIPQNILAGDCGMYSLKFVKFLALGLTFNGICDENIQGI